MTKEEWNHINDDLINVFHWIDEFEETHPDTEIQELRYHLIGLYDWLQDTPTVTPQPKMGRWIEHFDESGKWYECDQCYTDWGGPVNYCPNCGAKIEDIIKIELR